MDLKHLHMTQIERILLDVAFKNIIYPPEESREKKTARRARRDVERDNESSPVCTSCGEQGHRTSRNPECRNHNFTLTQLLNRDLGEYERYTLSVTLDPSITNNNHTQTAQNKIILLPTFLREVVYKAQLFINFYILTNRISSTAIFEQNFWYRVCRVIFGRLTIQQQQLFYPNVENLEDTYQTLTQVDGVNLNVNLNGITNYGEVVSSACETIATCYNNYYVENFENILANYFIYIIRVNFGILPIGAIKNIVYNYLLDHVLVRQEEPLVSPGTVLLPVIPLNRAVLSRNPQDIIPVFRYILDVNENRQTEVRQTKQIQDQYSIICKTKKSQNPIETVKLQISDFNSDEIERYFRVCTVDPGRRDVFNSYHGNDDIRRLTTSEYYNASGSPKRMQNVDKRKIRTGLEEIETNISTPKTTNREQFIRHIQYIITNLDAFFTFYSFRVAELNWKNWRGRQQALDKKEKKENSIESRMHRPQFNIGDTTKMPLVIFGDGLTNKSSIRFRGLRYGVSEKIYKHLCAKQRLGELYILDINEYNTSKVAEDEHLIYTILICNDCNIFWNRDIMAAKNMSYIAEEFGVVSKSSNIKI
ncbi:MAG: hypothetical protein EXX96DRAFT_540759 [Benjaminiella poitrasii]|nr:MAG: hypothetical protein EXX96DRAFT_540759 [Benjaminiella poitrasii]